MAAQFPGLSTALAIPATPFGGIGHVEKTLLLKPLCDLTCDDPKKGVIVTSSCRADDKVKMIRLNRHLVDLDKEFSRILFDDTLREFEISKCPKTA